MAIATQEQSVVDAVHKQLYIGGEWRDGTGSETIDVEDPATGEAICQVADAKAEDARAALGAYYAGTGDAHRMTAGLLVTPAAVRDAITAYGDLGADEVVLYCWATDVDQVERLADATG